MSRIIDLLAIVAVAGVLLLPKPSIQARPAFRGQPLELDRLAELQDQRYRHPEDVDATLALADALGDQHPEWSLAALDRFASRNDYRVHLELATAHADRLELERAVAESDRVEALCSSGTSTPPCTPGTLARIGLIRQTMQVLIDHKVDPAKDPVKAREEVTKARHPARYRSQPQ